MQKQTIKKIQIDFEIIISSFGIKTNKRHSRRSAQSQIKKKIRKKCPSMARTLLQARTQNYLFTKLN